MFPQCYLLYPFMIIIFEHVSQYNPVFSGKSEGKESEDHCIWTVRCKKMEKVLCFFGPWSQSWSLVQSQSWSLMMGIGAPLAPFSEKVQINNDTKMVSSRQTILEDQGKLQMSREPTKLSAFCQSSIKDFEIRIPYNCPDPSLLRCWLQWLQSDHFKGISAEYAYTWSNILQICN